MQKSLHFSKMQNFINPILHVLVPMNEQTGISDLIKIIVLYEVRNMKIICLRICPITHFLLLSGHMHLFSVQFFVYGGCQLA